MLQLIIQTLYGTPRIHPSLNAVSSLNIYTLPAERIRCLLANFNPHQVQFAVRSVCNHGNLVKVSGILLQDEILSNPPARVLPGDGVSNSLAFPPCLRILNANSYHLLRLAISQQACADYGEGFLALHDAVFHYYLICVRDSQHDVVQRGHR